MFLNDFINEKVWSFNKKNVNCFNQFIFKFVILVLSIEFMRRASRFLLKPLLFTAIVLTVFACKKEEVELVQEDPRLKYVGDWNFKGNSFSYSGYYIYNPEPTWTSTSSSSTSYNDSTGSIALGSNIDELIVTYCSTCQPVVYDIRENGAGKWTLSETEFFNDVQPSPPGYTSSYTTYNIQGWKL